MTPGDQYCFGPFYLDVAERELRHNHEVVALTAKTFDLLLILVQGAGRTFTKSELLAALWPGTAVEENNLAQTIFMLRKALEVNGNGDDSNYILTVPRRGYKFVGSVNRQDPNGDAVAPGSTPAVRAGPRASRVPWIAIAVAAFIAVAGVALWGWLQPPIAAARPVTRFSLVPPHAPDVPDVLIPTLSRDGLYLASLYSLQGPIYIRRADQFDSQPVAGTEGAFAPPCFSPDGRWIAFSSGGKQLRKAPVSGGEAVTLADGQDAIGLCDWGKDGYIYYAANTGIIRTDPNGGKAEVITAPDPAKNEVLLLAPQLLPGGKYLLFTIQTTKGLSSPLVAILNLQTHARTVVLEDAGFARYAPTGQRISVGHIVYGHGTGLFAVTFDVGRQKIGSPSLVLDGVQGTGSWRPFGLSDSGTLAYLPITASMGYSSTKAAWVDRQGREEAIPAGTRNFVSYSVRLSPDGTRFLSPIFNPSRTVDNLWLYDLAHGTMTRITFEISNPHGVFTPDGSRVIYWNASGLAVGSGGVLQWTNADGSGQPASLIASDTTLIPTSVSPDGQTLLFANRTRSVSREYSDIFALPLGSGAQNAKAHTLIESPFGKKEAMFSPDGRWIAYTSNESGRDEVYVLGYPGLKGKIQISTEGGAMPRWNRSGRELFYRNGGKLIAVQTEAGATFRAGVPQMLFDKPYLPGFDVSADGKRFLMMRIAPQESGPFEIRAVVNWFEELRQRAPAV
jgi:eukaryotic-like serine/threonine-protein kinase